MPQSKTATPSVITFTKTRTASATTIKQSSDGSSGNINPDTYYKAKELAITQNCTSVRVSFKLTPHSSYGAYGKVYKNNVAVGTERYTAANTPATFTQDFTGVFAAGDLVQIWAHPAQLNYSCQVSELRLMWETKLAIVQDGNTVTNELVLNEL